MKRLSILLGAGLAMLALLAVPSFAASAGPPGVTVVRAISTGGGPPKSTTPGEVSTSSGSLSTAAGETIGRWTYRTTYLGRVGQRGITHSFSTELTFQGKGKIVAAGALRHDTSAEQWFQVTRATGQFRGQTGVMRLVNFNTIGTPLTVYLVNGH